MMRGLAKLIVEACLKYPPAKIERRLSGELSRSETLATPATGVRAVERCNPVTFDGGLKMI
jgi:hypothetical protein